ncbi:hypothetical protein J6590_060976 [Homalodisca vitripennis]|nr:hypothetical protein J6590_060976 [Homalodisca vitripennis]
MKEEVEGGRMCKHCNTCEPRSIRYSDGVWTLNNNDLALSFTTPSLLALTQSYQGRFTAHLTHPLKLVLHEGWAYITLSRRLVSAPTKTSAADRKEEQSRRTETEEQIKYLTELRGPIALSNEASSNCTYIVEQMLGTRKLPTSTAPNIRELKLVQERPEAIHSVREPPGRLPYSSNDSL